MKKIIFIALLAILFTNINVKAQEEKYDAQTIVEVLTYNRMAETNRMVNLNPKQNEVYESSCIAYYKKFDIVNLMQISYFNLKTKEIHKEQQRGFPICIINDNLFFAENSLDGYAYVHIYQSTLGKDGKIKETLQLFQSLGDLYFHENGIYISPNGGQMSAVIAKDGKITHALFDLTSERLIEIKTHVPLEYYPFYDYRQKKIRYYNPKGLKIMD
ncbi:MAG: hypothetical protein LBK47_03330 [Prevotellaceae bacterium]|jgi:hypothetical protein|nr:hypothetical protein [Prevotellaceae bacterium]